MTTLAELKKEKLDKSYEFGAIREKWLAGKRQDRELLQRMKDLTTEILDLGQAIVRMENLLCRPIIKS